MTVAPPFALAALFVLAITFAFLGGGAGLVIWYLGLKFPLLKVQRPIRSVGLAIVASFPLIVAIAAFQFLESLVPGSGSISIPYSVTLYLASFGVFFFRIEAPLRCKRALFAIAFIALIPPAMFEFGSYALAGFL